MAEARSSPGHGATSDGQAGEATREGVVHDLPGVGDHHDGHGHEELRPGWSRPKPEHVPRPTYWPAVLAFGVTFLFWGLISSPIVAAVGLTIGAIGLAGWIGELRHDH